MYIFPQGPRKLLKITDARDRAGLYRWHAIYVAFYSAPGSGVPVVWCAVIRAHIMQIHNVNCLLMLSRWQHFVQHSRPPRLHGNPARSAHARIMILIVVCVCVVSFSHKHVTWLCGEGFESLAARTHTPESSSQRSPKTDHRAAIIVVVSAGLTHVRAARPPRVYCSAIMHCVRDSESLVCSSWRNKVARARASGSKSFSFYERVCRSRRPNHGANLCGVSAHSVYVCVDVQFVCITLKC